LIDRQYFLNSPKPLLLDGPMGSRLIEYGQQLNTPIWSAEILMKNPGLIQSIHTEYIDSGADIIRTNTFRTNPYACDQYRSKIDYKHLVKIAVEAAKNALTNSNKVNLLVAGSNAPASDCYSKNQQLSSEELYNNHIKHISTLYETGVDFILNETFGDHFELEIAAKICYELKIPFAASLLINNENETYHGQNLKSALQNLLMYDPIFVSLNCCHPDSLINALPMLADSNPFGVYPNLGTVDSFTKNFLVRDFTESDLTDFTNSVINSGASVIGVCCGGNSDDVRLMRRLIDARRDEIH